MLDPGFILFTILLQKSIVDKILVSNISPLNFGKTYNKWKQQNLPENIGCIS
jgi:hypothetical protein